MNENENIYEIEDAYPLESDYVIEINSATITIPKGFCVSESPVGFLCDNYLSISFDYYSVDFEVIHNSHATLESLSSCYSSMYQSEILFKEITLNGFKAYCATYDVKEDENFKASQTYEIRFQIEESEAGNTELVVTADAFYASIEEVKEDANFKRLISGIRKRKKRRGQKRLRRKNKNI